MEIFTLIQWGFMTIGAATVLLNIVAPLTKNKNDDKILAYLKIFLKAVSLNVKDDKLEIIVRR